MHTWILCFSSHFWLSLSNPNAALQLPKVGKWNPLHVSSLKKSQGKWFKILVRSWFKQPCNHIAFLKVLHGNQPISVHCSSLLAGGRVQVVWILVNTEIILLLDVSLWNIFSMDSHCINKHYIYSARWNIMTLVILTITLRFMTKYLLNENDIFHWPVLC